MKRSNIGFLGGGNMAQSLVAGMLANDFRKDNIWVCDTNDHKLNHCIHHYGVFTTSSSEKMLKECHVIILAVKPQSLSALAKEIIAGVKSHHPLIISICAGIDMEQLEQLFGDSEPIIRAMPNIPALIQCGATGLYANSNIANQQKNLAEHIMRSSGVALWIENEALMNTVGAISGSGPAYFFYLMEHLIDYSKKQGLSEEQASLLTKQTAYGAAKMVLESDQTPAQLRHNVTSKGGITEAALNTLDDHNTSDILKQALKANEKRSEELAEAAKNTPKLDNNEG